jgi:hypothetical protein
VAVVAEVQIIQVAILNRTVLQVVPLAVVLVEKVVTVTLNQVQQLNQLNLANQEIMDLEM